MPNQPFPPGEATGGAGSPGPLAAKLGRLPRSPGVYLFKDARGRTIYAGKAAVLAARVRGYFTRDGDGRVNLPFLMRHVADVETIVTATEKDALVLENEVIKKEKPRYNVLLKDDKHFAVIRVSVKHRFPRVSVERAFRRDGGLYFGPFTSAGAMRETLKTLGQVFPLRRCTDYELAHRERPCLYWDIGCCAAPCVGRIGEAEYRAHVEGFVATLQGKDEALPTRLRDEMEAAARDLRFEDAARRRDQLRALETVTAQHRPVAPGMEDFDAFGAHRVRTHAEFSVAQVRAGKIAWVDSYTVKSELPDDDLLASVVARYYDRRDFVPRAVLLPRDLPGAEVIAAWLAERRGGPVDLAVPQRGEKRRVLEMAEENARENYRVKIDAEQRNRALLEALRDALSLVNLPARIECVDNSNIQGTSPVAAVVAFTNGVPDKARYRKYRVKSVAGADDFATMEEVLRRRLARAAEDEDWPDLLIIDGGPGQLTAAGNVMREAAPALPRRIDLIALAKARWKPAGRGRLGAGRWSDERVFKPGMAAPIVLDQRSPELMLLARVRDEAHRFAISFHRQVRGKSALATGLEGVPGLGPKRRRALRRVFPTLDALRAATTAQIAAAPGISPVLAERIAAALAKPPVSGLTTDFGGP